MCELSSDRRHSAESQHLHFRWPIYNYYRDGYDPTVGRYTQSDPVGLESGLDPYVYVDGNPVLYVDPLGLWAFGDPLSQGVVNVAAGFDDGVYRVVTLGIGDLNDLRQCFDIDGGVDVCSSPDRLK